MKKRSNLWKVIWVVGIYALLTTILYLVVLYKVKWEHKDLNTYLYFYDCNHNLCTSTTVRDNYYSKVKCEDDICPYIDSVLGDNVVLNRNNISWIYNYIDGEIVNNNYVGYRHIRDDIFVFTDSYGKQGVISLSDGVLVQSEYEYIDDYKDGFISYKKNGFYGIDTLDDLHDVDANYEDIVLINDKLFAGKKNNIYYLYSFDNISDENVNKYNFVYAYDNIILTINNKKIDILDVKLKSTLLMKIDTFYEYTTEKERDSLNLYFDGENILFDVFTSENEYKTYKYNLLNKKLI